MKRTQRYQLVATYDLSKVTWDYIMTVNLNQLARRDHDSSGYGFGERDVEWSYATRHGAENAAKRMKKARIKSLRVSRR